MRAINASTQTQRKKYRSSSFAPLFSERKAGGEAPPAILADEQAKIMNLSFAKPCPFVRHKRNRTKAVRPPAIYADEQAKITNLILRENTPVFVP